MKVLFYSFFIFILIFAMVDLVRYSDKLENDFKESTLRQQLKKRYKND
jgi:hypothetical protein